MTFQYPTTEELVIMHALLITKVSGKAGVRDFAKLESVVDAPHKRLQDYGGTLELCAKAAVLAESIVVQKPFVDGNVPMALLAIGRFLRLNGYALSASGQEIEETFTEVADGSLPRGILQEWLRDAIVAL